MTTLNDINNLVNDRRRDSGTNSIDMTADGFRAVNSALDIWNQTHDWEFQIEETLINYNKGVTYYDVPKTSGTVVFKAPIDLRYYRTPRTAEFDRVAETSFDSDTLKTRRFAISTTGQAERIRIEASGNTAQIHTLGDTDDGTWTASGAISDLTDDSYEYFDLSSSVKFTYSGTNGTVTITGISARDLTAYQDRSSIYWNARSDSWTGWTSMTLKLGSDASNYYTASVTSDYLSEDPVADRWTKFKIAWSSLTSVGTPVITGIDYIQLQVQFSSDPSATMWIENLFVSEDVPLLFEYYSTNMVTDVSATTKIQRFNDSASTSDRPLWSGKWDWANEAFVNSVLEIIFFMTGEYNDMSIAVNNIQKIVENLKAKLPSRRRQSEITMKIE